MLIQKYSSIKLISIWDALGNAGNYLKGAAKKTQCLWLNSKARFCACYPHMILKLSYSILHDLLEWVIHVLSNMQ